MGGELVTVEREDATGNLVMRVVDSSRLDGMLADGWRVKPESNGPISEAPQVCIPRPLYNDMLLSVKEANAGKRNPLPLTGSRKDQLKEAQRQFDKKYGEGRIEVGY